MNNLTLESFRSNIDGKYEIILASDSNTNSKLVAVLEITYECGGYSTSFYIRANDGETKIWEGLAAATRKYHQFINLKDS